MARKFETREQFIHSLLKVTSLLATEFELTDKEIDKLIFDMPGGTEPTFEDVLCEMCGDPDYRNWN